MHKYKLVSSILLCVFFILGSISMFACTAIGQLPKGERLSRIEKSPNYKNGEFVNLEETPMLTGNESKLTAWWNFLFKDYERIKPSVELSKVVTDVKKLDNTDLIIWFGHSSFYMQLDGKKLLIDPVFNDYAAPLPIFNTAFMGENPYTSENFPELDYLIISHDHYDHLEQDSIKNLATKVKKIICPLGVGQHLEYWGVNPDIIYEGDWGDFIELENIKIDLVPARHFSGRFLSNNKTLWSGFIFTASSGKRVYYTGDSGYGKHFKDIGDKFKDIDLTIIENGQYNDNWRYIHMTPEEAVQASLDVNTKAVLPVHAGRFAMSNHTWDDPYIRLAKASIDKNYTLLTPKIGQIVFLDGREQDFTAWWEEDLQRELQQIK